MTALEFIKSYLLNWKLLAVTAVFAVANLTVNFVSTDDDVYEQLIQVETSGLLVNDFFSQVKKMDYSYNFTNNEPKERKLRIIQLTPFIYNVVISGNHKEVVEQLTNETKAKLEAMAMAITNKYFSDCRDSLLFLKSEIQNSAKFENKELAIEQINTRTKPCVDIFNQEERIINKSENTDKTKSLASFLLQTIETDLNFLSTTLEKKTHFRVTKTEPVELVSDLSIKKLLVAIIIFHFVICSLVGLAMVQTTDRKHDQQNSKL